MGNKAVTYVNGKLKKAGDTDTVDLDGNVNLGNANSDDIVFSGEVDSNIIPNQDNVFDLGSSSKKWAEVHCDDLYAYSNITFADNAGTFPTNTVGFYWDLNNDEARIYAVQPSSDAIDFVFKLSDNTHSQDRYIFWIDDYRGSSYDRYPLALRGDGVFFNMVHSSEGVPNFTTAKARIDSSGRLALRTSSDPGTLNDNAHIYSKNISGHAEMFVRDSQGNVTQISPHNEEGEWEYFSRNVNTGKVVRINMEKMIRKLEQLTGESFIEEWYE